MPIIEWKKSFMVGIRAVDRHHKHLVTSLNEAYDQFRDGKEIDLSFLQELTGYSAHHFASEEGWMKKTSYPDLALHQEEHAVFTARILAFKKEYSKNPGTSVALLWFLCNWVTHHIQETDVKFGRYLETQNKRRRAGTSSGGETTLKLEA